MFRLDPRLQTYDYESIQGSASSQSLTAAKYLVTPPCRLAIVTVDTAPIRWRSDGTAPTSSEGNFAIPTGDPILLSNGGQVANFKFINQGASNAQIRVSYLR